MTCTIVILYLLQGRRESIMYIYTIKAKSDILATLTTILKAFFDCTITYEERKGE